MHTLLSVGLKAWSDAPRRSSSSQVVVSVAADYVAVTLYVCVCGCWLGCCQLCVSHLDTQSALLTFLGPSLLTAKWPFQPCTHTQTHNLLNWPIRRSVGTKQKWHNRQHKKAVLVLGLTGSARRPYHLPLAVTFRICWLYAELLGWSISDIVDLGFWSESAV